MDGNPDEILGVIGEKPGFILGIYAVIGIAIIVFLVLITRKSRERNREITRRELQYYADNGFKWVNPNTSKSGNVSFTGDSLYYSRGPKRIKVEVYIQKNTTLTPDSIQEWFVNRNYNQREEEAILNDIRDYLIENRICKTVEITDGETDEFEEFYDNSSADD